MFVNTTGIKPMPMQIGIGSSACRIFERITRRDAPSGFR